MAFSVTDQLGTVGSTGATLAMTVNATVAIGSLVVVSVMELNTTGTAGTLADSAGNSYTKANDASPAATNSNGRASVFYCLKTTGTLTGGSSTITYTRVTSAVATGICAISSTYAGTIILDKNATPTTGTGTTNLTISATGTSGTELYVGAGGIKSAGAGIFTQGTGFSNGPDYENAGGGTCGSMGGNKTGSGAQTWAPTLSVSRSWAMFLLVFQEQTGRLFRVPDMDGIGVGGPFFADPLGG